MKKWIILCLALVLLAGCSGKTDDVEEKSTGAEATMDSLDDTYYKIINRGRSELGERFYTDFYSTNDFETIGRDLQILSSQYFSTSSHYMSEGQYFGREEKNTLIQRSSSYSLQPKKGTSVGDVKNAIMIQNLQEQDYYMKSGSKYSLKGVSISVVIDPKKSDNSPLDTPMSLSTIKSYGKECVSKLYKYITKSKNENMQKVRKVPILIAIYYATDKTESTINGRYIYECYCQNQLGTIKEVNHKQVIFSSSDAEKLDTTTYAEFNVIKNNLKNAATEAAGLVGKAKYIDNEIQSMVIEANLNIKTITELQYLTSLLADNIDSQFTYDFDIKVLVNSQDGLKAVIIKDKGESAKSSILY